MQKWGGEERTAGSDQKVRFSSGGPISLDPVRTNFLPYLPFISRLNSALMGGEGWGGVGGGGEGGGGGEHVTLYSNRVYHGRFDIFEKNTL